MGLRLTAFVALMIFCPAVALAGRQFVIGWIPDTQRVHSDQSSEIDDFQNWIWDRKHDCTLGVARNDATARGCIDFIAIIGLGDIVADIEAVAGSLQAAMWGPWWKNFNGAGPYGEGPIPWLRPAGNHDVAHAASYPGCNGSDPFTCECGSPVRKSGADCDESLFIGTYFPPTDMDYPGFIGCDPNGPANSYMLLHDVNMTCAARVPTGHGFGILIVAWSWLGRQSAQDVNSWGYKLAERFPLTPIFNAMHGLLNVTDDPEVQECVRVWGAWWDTGPAPFRTLSNHVMSMNGHAVCLDENNDYSVENERCGCHQELIKDDGEKMYLQFFNAQDQPDPPSATGIETLHLVVSTVDWDEGTIEHKVYSHAEDRFLSSGDGLDVEHTVSGMNFTGRFPFDAGPALTRPVAVALALSLGLLGAGFSSRSRLIRRGKERES